MSVPDVRVRRLSEGEPRTDGEFVLYWMIAARRTRYSFALDRAIEHARELRKPLLVLEPLRVGYPHASRRFHRFVLDGMAANAARLEDSPVHYHPYLEPEPGAGKGLLEALARRAAVVVTDDSPVSFLPRMLRAAARKVPSLLEAVDGNGLLPLRATERVFPTAYAFRRFLQKELPGHLSEGPRADPLRNLDLPRLNPPPSLLAKRWPAASAELLAGSAEALSRIPVDPEVGPVPEEGGSEEARRRLRRFVEERLAPYAELRNKPEERVTSELSPHLHFGHVSPHEVFARISGAESWDASRLDPKPKGKRSGYWGMSESAEAFLDQLVTWRELGYHTAAKLPRYDEYDALPGWAKETLEQHEGDPRDPLYDEAELAEARTHDDLWNAAQTQLRVEGRIHNYLRMLWGKKILQWTKDPRTALSVMLALNDRFALDGRDPNSVSGITWCLGRYDRPWGPERPVFGKIRYMTSENTARKHPVRDYIARYRP